MKIIIVVSVILLSILLLLMLGELVIIVKDTIKVISCYGSRRHDSKHPGIVEKTLLGKRDILCPRCNCPYCKYVYIYDNKQISLSEVLSRKRNLSYYLDRSPSDIIKDYIMELNISEKYICDNCEYIFD